MKEFQRKLKLRRRLYSLPVLIVLLLFTGMIIKGAIGMAEKESKSALYLEELEEKASVLNMRKDELEDNIRRLETDDGVIQEIKERFSVSEEGELVAIIVDMEDLTSSSTELEEATWHKKLRDTFRRLWRRQ
jgi:cell division protein FtsB